MQHWIEEQRSPIQASSSTLCISSIDAPQKFPSQGFDSVEYLPRRSGLSRGSLGWDPSHTLSTPHLINSPISLLSQLPQTSEAPSDHVHFPISSSNGTDTSSTLGSSSDDIPPLRKRQSLADALRPRRLSQSSSVLRALLRRSRVDSIVTSGIVHQNDDSEQDVVSPISVASSIPMSSSRKPDADLFPNLSGEAKTSRNRATSISSLSSLSSWTRRKRPKKRLLVSGIEDEATWKVDALRRWCEKFGKVKHVERMDNGDIQVNFKSPEIADEVCRLCAQVFIEDVGSVHLSYGVGRK